MRLNRIINLLIVTLLLTSLAGKGQEIGKQREELKRLREQIDKYEQEIVQKKAKEANTLELITSLDREIDVMHSFIGDLNSDIRSRERQISTRQKEIEQISGEQEKLADLIRKRMVNYYKHGRRHSFDLLLSSKSFNQVGVWLKFQKLITENDMRSYQTLINNKKRIIQGQQLLQAEIYAKEQNLSEHHKEASRLKNSREKRTQILDTIRSDTRLLDKQLQELKQSQDHIKNLISKSEEERITRSVRNTAPEPGKNTALPAGARFIDLKGKMPWPTQGKITSHFGRQRHPVLKTVTDNLGIEIKAPLGTPVTAVNAGQIQAITWQRGLGNIVIISHDDGYYTVYTHLAEINVDPLQDVQRGQVIGTVGDTGSMNGPVLHFQIWKNTQNLNPEEWIAG
ncbi:MAG TPA: peptidoglycan DD-metalloendopeptidase family protein [bacterium]|nr:peptidoglycan DD-metalloendopeptidase family protein [bacterium]HPN43796.1 peptidoglycan DD-metalloendopeptidase family protein [bacterium]